MIEKLISGGQTGVDRLAYDVAIHMGIPYDGTVPKNRRSEDGIVPMKYHGLTESGSADYLVRTRKNVLDADATLIFCLEKFKGGTKRTYEMALEESRIALVIRYVDGQFLGGPKSVEVAARTFFENDVKILNIAGPRFSSLHKQGVASYADMFLSDAFSYLEKLVTLINTNSVPSAIPSFFKISPK